MDLRLTLMGVLAASGGVLLGTLVQVGKTAMADHFPGAGIAPEAHQDALSLGAAGGHALRGPEQGSSSTTVAPELASIAHGVNRLARSSGARLHLRACAAPPCLVHLSWADDRDLVAEANLERAVRAMGWHVRGQATVIEAPGDGRWFSHYAAAIWPAAARPSDLQEEAALESVRNVLRAATR